MEKAKDTASILSAEEARRAYYKEWRAKNRDKVKRYNKNYWEKCAAKQQKNSDKTK